MDGFGHPGIIIGCCEGDGGSDLLGRLPLWPVDRIHHTIPLLGGSGEAHRPIRKQRKIGHRATGLGVLRQVEHFFSLFSVLRRIGPNARSIQQPYLFFPGKNLGGDALDRGGKDFFPGLAAEPAQLKPSLSGKEPEQISLGAYGKIQRFPGIDPLSTSVKHLHCFPFFPLDQKLRSPGLHFVHRQIDPFPWLPRRNGRQALQTGKGDSFSRFPFSGKALHPGLASFLSGIEHDPLPVLSQAEGRRPVFPLFQPLIGGDGPGQSGYRLVGGIVQHLIFGNHHQLVLPEKQGAVQPVFHGPLMGRGCVAHFQGGRLHLLGLGPLGFSLFLPAEKEKQSPSSGQKNHQKGNQSRQTQSFVFQHLFSRLSFS